MKIAILTHPLRRNYGGILQNWALQQVLKQMGHEPITLNWGEHKESWFMYFRVIVSVTMRNIFLRERLTYPNIPNYKERQAKGIRRFYQKQITKIDHSQLNDVISSIPDRDFDAIIVGSDQVWRAEYIRAIENMFLPFKKVKHQKKIAYAASFGVDEWEFTEEQTKCCAELIRDFDAVGVREYTGANLCKNHLNYDKAQWVLDPTLLLDKSDYDKLCGKIDVSKQGYVLAYILDDNLELTNIAKRKAEELRIPLKILSIDNKVTPNDTVEKWVSSFRDAQFVITDSFHGTVFSLIYKKSFAVYRNIERGNTRFDNLIRIFPQITDRIINNGVLPSGQIDWDAIDNSRSDLKIESIDFIKNALNK